MTLPTSSGPLPLPPSLETERLRLRPWVLHDAPALQAALAESVDHLAPWIPWATREPPDDERARALLARWVEERERGDNLIYAMERRGDGTLVGGVGLYDRVGPGRLEIGYWVRRSQTGLGFASEAVAALGETGLGVSGVEEIRLHTDVENLASRRVAERLGYRLVEVRPPAAGPRGGPLAVYALAAGAGTSRHRGPTGGPAARPHP